MEPEDRRLWRQEMVKTAAAFQVELTEDTFSVYWEELRDLPMESVVRALKILRREMEFKFRRFPYISEIRDLAGDMARAEGYVGPERQLSEDKGEAGMDPERARILLRELAEALGPDVNVKPELEGEEARRFEEKRRTLKRQLKSVK